MLTAIGCRLITIKYELGNAACRNRVIRMFPGVFSTQIILLLSQYRCQLALRPWIEPKPARAPAFEIEWINILKMFPLIDRYGGADVEGRILETGALLQSSNIATKHAGSASVQTAHEYVLVVSFMFL